MSRFDLVKREVPEGAAPEPLNVDMGGTGEGVDRGLLDTVSLRRERGFRRSLSLHLSYKGTSL